jgi:hypothetical protein
VIILDEQNNILKEIIETEKLIIKEMIRMDTDTKDMVIALQQEIAELRAMIEELKDNSNVGENNPSVPDEEDPSVPEIIKVDDFFSYTIADRRSGEEMLLLQEAIKDENVTGIMIRPEIWTGNINGQHDNYIHFDFEIDFANNEYLFNNETFTKLAKFSKVVLNIETPESNVEFSFPCFGGICNTSYSVGKEEGWINANPEVYQQFSNLLGEGRFTLTNSGYKCDITMGLEVRYAPPMPTDLTRTIETTYTVYL